MTGGPNKWLALLSCSQRQVQLRHRSSVREGEGVVVIKFLGLVRVDEDRGCLLARVAHYIYIGRSLRACLLGLLYSHTLIISRSKQDRGGNTVFLPSKNTVFLSSPLVIDPDVSPSAGRGGGAAFRPLSTARKETHCRPHRYLWPSAGARGPPIPSSLP